MLKKLATLSLAFVLVLALSSCETGEGAASGGTRDSIIRLTADSTPILDPASHAGYASSISYVNLYDTLVFPTSTGIEPNLAQSWESNAAGTEYTFHLKKGVKFHDGTELTASDVVFTTNRMIAVGEGFAYLYSGIVDEVIAVDDYTVKFTLHQPYGPFVATLPRLYILNEKLVMDNLQSGPFGEYGDYGRTFLLSNDAGSGPYKFKELVQNDFFLAERYDDWHGGWEGRDNSPDQFMILYGSEAATVRTMMSTRTLEITDMWQSPESIAALENIDGVSIAAYSTRLVQNIFYNGSIEPTDCVYFRKALSCLVDYATLIDVAFPGSRQPAGPVSWMTAGHVEATQFSFDLDEARMYLEMSKYADNYGDFTLDWLHSSESVHLERVALQVQAAAAEVGINIRITRGPWTVVQERLSAAESTPHLTSVNSGPQFNEAGATLESQFHTKTAGTYENPTWISTAELDAMIEDAMNTPNQEERFKKYEELQHYIVDELNPSAWIADLVERVAYQDYVDFPAAKATRDGEMSAYLMGYTYFMPNIQIFTDR